MISSLEDEEDDLSKTLVADHEPTMKLEVSSCMEEIQVKLAYLLGSPY